MAYGYWAEWHRDYEVDGPLARRMAMIQRHIAEFLAFRGERTTSVISMCSGDGRDLLGVLAARGPSAGNVVGRLVELDPGLCAVARQAIRDAALDGIRVANQDAGLSTAYVGAVPADLVLACGVFGNISDADVERTVRAMPMLCSEGAAVIWTRHRRPPDLTPSIRRWFREAGFVNTAFEQVSESMASVGVEVFQGGPLPLPADLRLFEFEQDSG